MESIKDKLNDHRRLNDLVFKLLEIDAESEEGNDKKFITSFQEFAPKIASEILTASVDANCTCKRIITNYIEIYKSETIDFLIDYATKNNFLDLLSEAASITDVPVLSDLNGKVVRVKTSEWKEFAEKLNYNVSFRSFSIIKENDDLIVFFL